MNMEAKAKVEVGQRREWKPSEKQRCRGPFTVIAGTLAGQFRCQYDKGEPGLHWSAEELDEFSVPLGSPPVAGVAMGDHPTFHWDGKPTPAGCLTCGGVRETGRIHSCVACYGKDNRRCEALWLEWKAGARDFPRPALTTAPTTAPAMPGIGQVWRHNDYDGGADYLLFGEEDMPVVGPRWKIRKVDGVKKTGIGWTGTTSKQEVSHSWKFVRYEAGTFAEVPPPAPVAAPKPPLREVSHNGKDGSWINFDRLTDSDSFDSYRHRRVDGMVVAMEEPRGYAGKTWSQHVVGDQNMAVGMRQKDHENPSAGRRLRAMATPEAAPYVCPVADEDLLPDAGTSYATPSAHGGRP